MNESTGVTVEEKELRAGAGFGRLFAVAGWNAGCWLVLSSRHSSQRVDEGTLQGLSRCFVGLEAKLFLWFLRSGGEQGAILVGRFFSECASVLVEITRQERSQGLWGEKNIWVKK